MVRLSLVLFALSIPFAATFASATPGGLVPGACLELPKAVPLREEVSSGSMGRLAPGTLLSLDTRLHAGAPWVRVLSVDGMIGWIPSRSVRVRGLARLSAESTLVRTVSPDDDAERDHVPEGEADTTVRPAGILQALRGSSRLHGPRLHLPRLPDAYDMIPWIRVSGSLREGWLPPGFLRFSCDGADTSGLARPPFVGWVRSDEPMAGAKRRVWDHWRDTLDEGPSTDTGFRPGIRLWVVRPPPGVRSGLVSVSGWEIARTRELDPDRDGRPSEGCLAVGFRPEAMAWCTERTDHWILEFADGRREVLRGGGETPLVLSARFVDLDADGAAEWIVETTTNYGDGSLEHLMVFDGVQSPGRLSFGAVSIGGNSGEPSAPEPVSATWKVAGTPKARLLEVRSRQGRRTDLVSWAWRGKRLVRAGR